MSIIINNRIASAIQKDTYNIIYFAYDGYYDLSLVNATNHTFYMYLDMARYMFNTSIWQAIPRAIFLTKTRVFPEIFQSFDVVICHNRIHHYDLAKRLSDAMHIPIIAIEHTPPNQIKKEDVVLLKQRKKVSRLITPHQVINQEWGGNNTYIPYAAPQLPLGDIERIDHQILITGEFNTQHKNLLQFILHNVQQPIILMDMDRQLQVSFKPKTFTEYRQTFQQSGIFLDLENDSGISRHTLFAMSAGCAIITHPSAVIYEVFGEDNALYANNCHDIVKHMKTLQQDSDKRNEYGARAKKLADTYFTQTQFAQQWTKLIDQVVLEGYKR